MNAEKSEGKDLEYIKQGTGSADARGTGAALKREAKELAKVGVRPGTREDTARDVAVSPFIQVDRVLQRCRYSQDALIEVLHAAQETFGFLSEDTMTYIAHQLKLPLSWVYGVTSFYHHFNLKPQGKHVCNVCLGTACFVKRSGDIVETLEREFDVKAGETTADGKLSINIVRCLGNCGLAPMIILDGKVHARQTPESMLRECKEAVEG
jgi:bidirectional [NiFe] hydrogenase diaphorase subunit